jgi:hypothetical protein
MPRAWVNLLMSVPRLLSLLQDAYTGCPVNVVRFLDYLYWCPINIAPALYFLKNNNPTGKLGSSRDQFDWS